MTSGSDYANQIYALNHSIWRSLESVSPLPLPKPDKCLKNEKKLQEKPHPKEKPQVKKKHVEDERMGVKNVLRSFTSFLIPLYVTGDKKDYQLLYCICALKNAIKLMSTTVRKEGFAQLYMVGMKSQMDWEMVKENNVTFTDVIIDFLVKSGTVCMVAANKQESIKKIHHSGAPFVVLLTATDILLPCQANLCVGTGWLIFRRTGKSHKHLFDREAYNGGRRALHAGVLINGCNTIMTCAFKKLGGLHYFIFDLSTGDFRLFEEGCYMRPYGTLVSINEGLFHKFTPFVQNWLKEMKAKEDHMGYCSRYTGGWLSDGYKILRSGGLLISPPDSDANDARIKYLYKAVPLAYLAEKAGGRASNGRTAILKAKPTHSRNTPLILGSVEDVNDFIERVVVVRFGPELLFKNDTESDDTSTDFS